MHLQSNGLVTVTPLGEFRLDLTRDLWSVRVPTRTRRKENSYKKVSRSSWKHCRVSGEHLRSNGAKRSQSHWMCRHLSSTKPSCFFTVSGSALQVLRDVAASHWSAGKFIVMQTDWLFVHMYIIQDVHLCVTHSVPTVIICNLNGIQPS